MGLSWPVRAADVVRNRIAERTANPLVPTLFEFESFDVRIYLTECSNSRERLSNKFLYMTRPPPPTSRRWGVD